MRDSARPGWWSQLTMRASPAEYLSLPLRVHELLHDVRLYDVSVIRLPGGGRGRTVADVRALDLDAEPSRIAFVIYQLRHFLGRMFGWDGQRIRPEESLLRRLSECDRRSSEVPPGMPDGEFLLLYRFRGEELREILNATVHGFLCTALVSTPTDYRLYWGVSSGAFRGSRDRTSSPSSLFAGFCTQPCCDAFGAVGSPPTALSHDAAVTHQIAAKSPVHYLLETSRPRIFAVGDVRGGNVERVASAVGEGSIAVAFGHQVFRQ